MKIKTIYNDQSMAETDRRNQKKREVARMGERKTEREKEIFICNEYIFFSINRCCQLNIVNFCLLHTYYNDTIANLN